MHVPCLRLPWCNFSAIMEVAELELILVSSQRTNFGLTHPGSPKSNGRIDKPAGHR